MIYILLGNDIKNKSLYIKELTENRESFLFRENDSNKDLIMSYSNNTNLFNVSPVIILENVLDGDRITFGEKELMSLKESETIFVFKEDKMSVVNQKKYKKY